MYITIFISKILQHTIHILYVQNLEYNFFFKSNHINFFTFDIYYIFILTFLGLNNKYKNIRNLLI